MCSLITCHWGCFTLCFCRQPSSRRVTPFWLILMAQFQTSPIAAYIWFLMVSAIRFVWREVSGVWVGDHRGSEFGMARLAALPAFGTPPGLGNPFISVPGSCAVFIARRGYPLPCWMAYRKTIADTCLGARFGRGPAYCLSPLAHALAPLYWCHISAFDKRCSARVVTPPR